jgi:hypothetical protein
VKRVHERLAVVQSLQRLKIRQLHIKLQQETIFFHLKSLLESYFQVTASALCAKIIAHIWDIYQVSRYRMRTDRMCIVTLTAR